jgi:hypothetical protein
LVSHPYVQMIAVPIRLRNFQKAVFVQKMQHAIPSIVVLGDGLDHLSHDPHGVDLALGLFEVGAALLVMASVVRGLIQLRQNVKHVDHVHEHGIDWIDIFIGAMLGVEAYAKYHATAHIPRPTILLAVMMIIIGLVHGQLAAWGDRRRQLRVSADGISMPRLKFARMTLTWAEVESIELDDRAAVIKAIDGRSKRIEFGDVMQPTAIRDALMSARTFLDGTRHAANASIESTPSDT